MLVKCLKVILSLKKIKSFLQNLVSINDGLSKYFQEDRAGTVPYIILGPNKEPQKASEIMNFIIFCHTEETIEAERD